MSNMNKVLGFERINERVKRPNALINFIKPLDGPDKALAQDFLERVAAICYPIMKANHIVVMSLEEYPPNMEFVGRNFNAGEVIQLVLKSPGTKQWLPFKHVQMVMMHELAHCKQMNHSKFFWQVRNSYADELKDLWSKSYTGEGLWGRGLTLLSGRYATEHMPDAASEPRSLCGGTFRRQGRKRKRGEKTDNKPKVSYAERQQRRIAKKFGVAGLNGVTLGDDEHTRNQLEKNRYNPTKPRVAKSKRGRELRAAAALARFETNKTAEVKAEAVSIDSTEDEETETESEGEELGEFSPENNPNMVRVCGDEDPKDDDAQREMKELHDIDQQPPARTMNTSGKSKLEIQHVLDDVSTASEDEEPGRQRTVAKPSTPKKTKEKPSKQIATPNNPNPPSDPHSHPAKNLPRPIKITQTPKRPDPPFSSSVPASTYRAAGQPCPICSLENSSGAATCVACSHVLDTARIRNSWKCTSSSCRGSEYRNLGDYGRCGLCGASKPDSVRVNS